MQTARMVRQAGLLHKLLSLKSKHISCQHLLEIPKMFSELSLFCVFMNKFVGFCSVLGGRGWTFLDLHFHENRISVFT